jgi:hypothetical protein
MSRKATLLCVLTIATLAITGCTREEGNYTITENNTVNGTIILAVPQNETNDAVSTWDTATIAAEFAHATVTDLGSPDWVGSRITFSDEPIATFHDPTELYQIGITRVGSQFVVEGAPVDPSMAEFRQAVIDSGGIISIRVAFPGEVYEHNGSLSGNAVTWSVLTQSETIYARGSAVPPPPADPVPDPDPANTIVITPSAAVQTPTPTPNVSPSATPSAGVVEAKGNSIPMWVWAVGGVLVAALAGMIGYLVANRKPAVPAPVTTATKPKTKVEPSVDETGEPEVADTAEEAPPPSSGKS